MPRDPAYRGSGIASLVSGFYGGQDRSRAQAKEAADSQEKQDEFRRLHAPYSKGQTDQYGFATGLDPDEEGPEAARARAYGGYDKDDDSTAGASNPKTPAAPAPPLAAPVQPPNAPVQQPPPPPAPTDSPHPAAGPGKPDLAPGDPTPLIRDPKANLNEQQQQHDVAMASADAMVNRPSLPAPAPSSKAPTEQAGPNGERVMMPEGATSMEFDPSDPKINVGGKSVVPARKTVVPSGGDVELADGPVAPPIVAKPAPAPAASPAQAPAPSRPKLIPDENTLEGLVKRDTTLPRAGGALIDVNNLPQAAQDALGISDEMRASHVKIPSSIVNAIMGDSTKVKVQGMKNEGQTVDPKFASVIDALQNKEVPLGSAIAAATRINGGQRPPQAVLNAMKNAGTMGNADRSYGLAEDRFDQSKSDKGAGISGDYAKKALNDTKSDLEAMNTLNTVDRMLQRKDTNGLRKLVPIIIERGFVPQRLTNQMVSSDTGLTDIGNGLDQWLEGLNSGTITPQNVALFRSLVQEGRNEHQANYSQKIQRWKRAGVGALMAHGMEQGAALDTMGRALDPDTQTANMGAPGAAAPAEDEDASPPPSHAPKAKFAPPTKDELDLRKEMMHATQALRQAGSDPKKQAVIKGMFKQRTGIDWDAKGGAQ